MKITKILLAINIFALQSYLIRFNIGGYPSNLQEILLIALTASFITEVILNKKLVQTIKNVFTKKVILIFLSLTAISTILNWQSIAPTQNIDFLRHIKFLTGAIIFSFIFTETIKTKKESIKIIKWGTFGLILFIFFSLIFNILGYNAALDYRLRGPLDSAVYLAYYIAPFLILSINQLLEKKSKTNIITTPILVLGLIATKSMGSILSIFIVSMLLLIRKSNKNFIHKKSTKLTITTIGILIAIAIIQIKIIPTLTTNYSSLDERGQIWKTAIYTIQETPQILIKGAGPSQFEKHYIKDAKAALGHEPLDYHVIQPHNIFILTTFNYGILGVVMLILIIISTLKTIFSTKNLNNSVSYIAAIITTYFLIHGLIDTPIYKNDILIILILTLSIQFNYQYKLKIKKLKV